MAGGLVQAITTFLTGGKDGNVVQVSATNPLPVTVISGGGGGGGGGTSDASAANQVITNDRLGPQAETAPTTDIASSGLNGRLQRIAQNITTQSALLPATLGAKAAASSFAVTLATDDVSLARYGTLTEAAPASDTASSGLNGRLQRIAQRLTSLIALLPASLGAKTAALSLAVTTATDDVSLARYGAVTETAPANDTASSGLNGRLQRVAQNITAQTALLPTSLGAKTAAASFAVTLATDDVSLARYGTLTEAAPATDTASSGLNGRLQRVAQNITSLIAQLPATLGAKVSAASLSIVPASDATFNTALVALTAGVNRSGTATTVAGALTVPANANRRALVGQNTSSVSVGFNEFGAAPTIGALGTYVVTSGASFAITTNNAVQFVAATGSANITMTEV